MDTAMSIKYVFNLVCQVHMNPLGIQCASHPIHPRRWTGSGLKLDALLFMIYVVTPTMRSLVCSLAWLVMALWHVLYRYSCSALAGTLEKKEACFLMTKKSGTEL